MARRPFDPAAAGLRKTEYRQGDVLDRDARRRLVAGADVVVHLAFLIIGGLEETQRINLEGSRNVFEAAVAAGAKRLVYASSVAAYGFHADNPPLLTEDVPPRGTDRHYYSAQKAKLEGVLGEVARGHARPTAYVFRPCIVAGPDALMLVENIPYIQLSDRMPGAVLRALELMPALKPVLPDPGVPFQLVHHDDVATALRAGVLGRGTPGVYNLAGRGRADDVRPRATRSAGTACRCRTSRVDAAAELVARLPFVPAEAQWIEAVRTPGADGHRARRAASCAGARDTTRSRRCARWSTAARSEQLIR